MPRELLTSTRLATLRRCPWKHYLRYELGLSRTRVADYFRMGRVIHKGRDLFNRNPDATAAIEGATAGYEHTPEWADPYKWQIEGETARRLLEGHFWRYGNDNIEIVETVSLVPQRLTEVAFKMPLLNPYKNRRRGVSHAFALAGKIDTIVRLLDHRVAVGEYKTAGEDIDPNGNYWQRLRCDAQLSMYILGARALGYDTNVAFYDVIRKPGMRPLRATPPEKRKFKQDGTLYASQREQDESPAEFGARYFADMQARPDYYFQRREIVRLEDELLKFQAEVWWQAKVLLERRRHGYWERDVSRVTCRNCEFRDLCLSGVAIEPDVAPAGFQILTDVHPELSEGDAE